MTEKETIKEIEQNLIDDFSLLETWEEKYEYLIEIFLQQLSIHVLMLP